MSTLLLSVAVASAFLPEVFAALLGGTVSAWFYVCSGLEAAALWLVIGSTAAHWLTAAVATWGFFEAASRPICRLAFPMDRPPKLAAGQNLCDAATDVPMSWVSVLAALMIASLMQECGRAYR